MGRSYDCSTTLCFFHPDSLYRSTNKLRKLFDELSVLCNASSKYLPKGNYYTYKTHEWIKLLVDLEHNSFLKSDKYVSYQTDKSALLENSSLSKKNVA